MEYILKSGKPQEQRSSCLVLGVFDKRKLSPSAAAVDAASKGALTRILKKGDMDGKTGQSALLYDLPGVSSSRVLLIGLGPEKEFSIPALRKASATAAGTLNESHAIDAISCLPALAIKDCDTYETLRETILATEEVLYRFDECKSNVEKPKRPLKKMGLCIGDQRRNKRMEQAIVNGKAIAKGVSLAKNLGNLPGNICTPGYLADQAKSIGRKSAKLKVQVLEEKKMEALGMGALLSVSRGSRQPAKLIIMEYKGDKPKSKPVVLVGKGLTFDSGGISIKPSAAMDEMKYDMCGGASVLGTMAACIEMELPINLVGIVPTSENLPDGDANKPGDIVTSMAGLTIEVLNTDAEGRLILCDALTYAKRFDPAAVIDIATLTGACIVALGDQASGMLSNNDALAEEVLTAGKNSGDRAWQLPLWDDYQAQLDSNFADMANIGGKGAGTITAACFLSQFTKDFKWAHLDIAGTAWKSGASKGATGRPVPLLSQFLLKRCGQ
ncbi:leucyl aminopeptidase [Solemya velesiana gill symbiont]|uniref:Probable cytosol aminopeptidase n=1 Tax=Solemya velesiana gill symbiont TaxID=1918948 RepID=A0A1T2KVD4_9GAMM|nr:leucyl aminopeptidase [Solemya velesiana gill symbiont]OOZ36805.1 leucyl aminopeptidase [Solemya velesiana gill symbiont]